MPPMSCSCWVKTFYIHTSIPPVTLLGRFCFPSIFTLLSLLLCSHLSLSLSLSFIFYLARRESRQVLKSWLLSGGATGSALKLILMLRLSVKSISIGTKINLLLEQIKLCRFCLPSIFTPLFSLSLSHLLSSQLDDKIFYKLWYFCWGSQSSLWFNKK